MTPATLSQTLQQELNSLTLEQLQQVASFIAFLRFQERQLFPTAQTATAQSVTATANHQFLQVTPVIPGSGYTNTALEHDAVLAEVEVTTP